MLHLVGGKDSFPTLLFLFDTINNNSISFWWHFHFLSFTWLIHFCFWMPSHFFFISPFNLGDLKPDTKLLKKAFSSFVFSQIGVHVGSLNLHEITFPVEPGFVLLGSGDFCWFHVDWIGITLVCFRVGRAPHHCVAARLLSAIHNSGC